MHTNASDIANAARLYKHPRVHFPSDTPTRTANPRDPDRTETTITYHHAPRQVFWNDDNTSPNDIAALRDPTHLRITSVSPEPHRLITTLHTAPQTLASPHKIADIHLRHYAEQQNILRQQIAKQHNIPLWWIIRVELCGQNRKALLEWQSDLAPLYEEEAANNAK